VENYGKGSPEKSKGYCVGGKNRKTGQIAETKFQLVGRYRKEGKALKKEGQNKRGRRERKDEGGGGKKVFRWAGRP